MPELRPLKYAFVVGVAVIILAGTWRTRNEHLAFATFFDVLRIVVLLVIALLAFWADRQDARRASVPWPYSASVMAGAAVLVFAAIKGHTAWNDSRPDLVRAGQFQDFNGSSLELKTDGHYRYCDIVLGETCCWGTYTLHNDTVELVSSEGCRSGTLVFMDHSVNGPGPWLRWTNEGDSTLEMRVLEDHRH